jgi:hypothetical protein
MSEFKMPTETIELPSKGLLYPESNPLSSGRIEMKYMTAKEEDILTNQSYIKDGTVLDKLLQSLIISKVDYNDLLIGDKNAVMIASRILGYGSDYNITYGGRSYTIDLTKLEHKSFDEELITKGVNEFKYTLPSTGTELTFKLLTHGDEMTINKEIQGYKKINKDASPELSTRLKYIITSVNSQRDSKVIRDFVDNHFLARDSRAFREYMKSIQPDIDLTYELESGEVIDMPINLSFFWPDA